MFLAANMADDLGAARGIAVDLRAITIMTTIITTRMRGGSG